MLTELRIKNFAIIETVTLPMAPGFNVLSGETGAGKSIIVGALGLLIGERRGNLAAHRHLEYALDRRTLGAGAHEIARRALANE